MSAYETARGILQRSPKTWLVTGGAGFIGSHLIQLLLQLGQSVRALDNLSTGGLKNLDFASGSGTFELSRGDIRDVDTCRRACAGVDYVLHHAAIGSVPASLADPVHAHAVNVTGFVNVLDAARETRVKRIVYASSSAVYGDEPTMPKVETKIGRPLSPYALTKRVNELYAQNFYDCFRLETVGLRYFNVFGPRQDPAGPYAAVIPKWIESLLQGTPAIINGDGETTRDFCHVADVAWANVLSATAPYQDLASPVYNIGSGRGTTLNELFRTIHDEVRKTIPGIKNAKPDYRDFRPGDIRHSQADITLAKAHLGYEPQVTLDQGLATAIQSCLTESASKPKRAFPPGPKEAR